MTGNTLVIVGSGPGIGVSTASCLAAHKFQNIALISRDATRLPQDRESVLSYAKEHGKTANVETWSCDITDTTHLEEVLKEVEAMGGISCVIFNAAEVAPSDLFKFREDEILYHFKTTNIGLYTTARWALPLLGTSPPFSSSTTASSPCFLVTTGLLHDDPIPQLFSLSMVKASQRTLVLALQKSYPDIHIALLYIDGPVSPEDVKNNPKNIAQAFWRLEEQSREEWTGDLVVT